MKDKLCEKKAGKGVRKISKVGGKREWVECVYCGITSGLEMWLYME